MRKNIEIANEIINKIFSKDDENYGLLVLGCYGLLTKFGENYTPIIEKLFLETNFFIANKNLMDLFNEAGLNPDEYGFTEDWNKNKNYLIAISIPGNYLYFEQDGTVGYVSDGTYVLCSTSGYGKKKENKLLNSFIHEMAHLVKGYINTVVKEKSDNYAIRSGVNILESYVEADQVVTISKNTILDEVINTLQVVDMLEKIKKLDKNILSLEVANYFNKLDLESLDTSLGYDFAVRLVEPLWANIRFKNNIEDNIVEGNIEKIEDDFNQVIGSSLFETFSRYLDTIDDNFLDANLVEKYSEIVSSIVDLYNIKCNYEDKCKS